MSGKTNDDTDDRSEATDTDDSDRAATPRTLSPAELAADEPARTPAIDTEIPSPATSDADFDDPVWYLNREFSELNFQWRVLYEALDERNPLLERVRFLAIATRNLDEFVMKRVGGLKQQIEAGVTDQTPDGRTPSEQWEEIHKQLDPILTTQRNCYRELLQPALAAADIEIVDYASLSTDERRSVDAYFRESVLPTLTPLTFDPAHPFPFISNRSLSLAVLTRRGGDDEPTFTRIKIPPNRPRLVAVEEGNRYVLVEDVIQGNLDQLLPNVEVVDTALFRLTRNAEVRRNEEVAEDLIEMIEDVLEQRRFATVVRLEVEPNPDPRILETLREQLELKAAEIYELDGPIDYRGFAALTDLERPTLKREPWTPKPHPRLQDTSSARLEPDREGEQRIFDSIDSGDILLHHPYHSFEGTVQRFLSEAAEDPDVLAVKAAIYRTASDSQVIQSLIDAAENGKQVAVMVELKARFDEQNNLEWVRRLEENGIHVAYGTIGLKTHTKTALVVRESGDGVRLYSHVGTGNYHSETAKGYVDLGLLTADRDIGHDLVTLFNSFTGPGLDEEYRKLLVAPVTMRDRITRCIRREADHARADRSTRIVIKVNGLEDPAMVEALYQASMAGVEIDLIVRDICRLRPDIEGVSDTVTVHSVVGRFLEHSRIFYFENGRAPEYYLGSADLMTRNLDYRIEAVTPVEDVEIRRQLKHNLELLLSDNRRRWTMNPDGSYDHCYPDPGESPVDVQEVLMAEATDAARDDDVSRSVPPERTSDGDLLVDSRDANTGPSEGAATSPATTTSGADGTPEVFRRHDDHWYVPDSEVYEYAVRTPDEERRYLKTEHGAIELLKRLYGK